jgi:hypothetical protein
MPSATAAAGTAASNPRRRGLSLASLSLRRRPQVALPRSESTNFSSLGRSTLGRRSIAAASIGKRNGGHGGNDNSVSAMSRSFSSRSFFSNRTFGVGSGPAGPSPESSFLHQKTVTDIDRECTSRNSCVLLVVGLGRVHDCTRRGQRSHMLSKSVTGTLPATFRLAAIAFAPLYLQSLRTIPAVAPLLSPDI